eukprot:2448153-Pyramimonas_sp.AAC.1
MSGMMTADVQLARKMQVAVASQIPLVVPVKPWEPVYPEGVHRPWDTDPPEHPPWRRENARAPNFALRAARSAKRE